MASFLRKNKGISEEVSHDHVPGSAYNITNPTTKLINMIGGSFFSEPKYYGPEASIGKIDSGESIANEVVETAKQIAQGDNPEDLLIIATWARDTKEGLKIRTTPQVLLAVAAAYPKTKGFVKKYASRIVQRPDEVREVFQAFRSLFQSHVKADTKNSKSTIPNCLKGALAERINTFPFEQILKYDDSNKPSFKDVLLMVDRAKDYPLSGADFDYLVNKKVSKNCSKVVTLREKILGKSSLDEVSDKELNESGLTWENLISKFGSSKENWERCIPIMGEMALTRNLRNFEQANISDEAWSQIEERLGRVENTKQLPFRFFSAIKNTSSTESKSILSKQLDSACQNLADLPGKTLLMVDNSGSAVSCPISGKSDMRVSDCGNTLMAVAAKKLGKRAKLVVFGDRHEWISFNPSDSCLTIKGEIDKEGETVGQSTETGLWSAIEEATANDMVFDRIILLSDICCYTQGDMNCGRKMKSSMQKTIEQYRAKVNKDCKVYSINIGGYAQSQLNPKDKNSYIMSGWSEKIFNLISDVESSNAGHASNKEQLATISVLRDRYLLKDSNNSVSKKIASVKKMAKKTKKSSKKS